MLTPQDLRSIHLRRRPRGQRLLANAWVRPSWFLRRVHIEVTGIEALVDKGPCLIAMNHTDRYNYWGLQVELYRRYDQFTSSWVKGKYYEHWFSSWFMRSTSNIPVPSLGYVIAATFKQRTGRAPTPDEYRDLRDLVDHPTNTRLSASLRAAVGADPLGWAASIEATFDALSREVVQLTGAALAAGLHVLIFPEGTRSTTLTRGHIGIAQMSQHFGVPIVPTGCSGSHRVYTRNTPIPDPGTVRYRVGTALHPFDDALKDHRVQTPFTPLTRSAREEHGPRFQGLVDVVMDRIAGLVDPEHRPCETGPVPRNAERFI